METKLDEFVKLIYELTIDAIIKTQHVSKETSEKWVKVLTTNIYPKQKPKPCDDCRFIDTFLNDSYK